MIKNSFLELSIQISLNGLSFSILDRKNAAITQIKHLRFSKKQTPFYVLDKLRELFESENSLNQTFYKVLVIHKNELATLVPKTLFQEDALADYLKFNAKILQTDFITYDEVSANDSMNVYVPYVNINNYIFERFGEFTYKHANTIFVNNIITSEIATEGTKMILNVSTTQFDVLIIRDKKLIFSNAFDYTTKEDFIYYILFTAEQLNISPESFELVFYGVINKHDGLYTIAYKYIRNVRFGNRMDTYSYTHKKPESNYSDYTLLKSF